MDVDSVKQRQALEDSTWLRSIGLVIVALTILAVVFFIIAMSTPLIMSERSSLQAALFPIIQIAAPLGVIVMPVLLYFEQRRRRSASERHSIAFFLIGLLGALIYLALAAMLYLTSRIAF